MLTNLQRLPRLLTINSSQMEIELTLTPLLKDQVVDELRVAFNDVANFNELIPILYKAMEEFVKLKFNIDRIKRLKMFADQYLPKYFATDAAGKARLEIIRLIVASCCVLLLSKHECARNNCITPVHHEASLEYYREANSELFRWSSEYEVARFVSFTNLLRTTLMVVRPRLNKLLIVNIACRLQTPKPLIYSWGDGMCIELKQFVAIYEKETGETLVARPERSQSPSAGLKKVKEPQAPKAYKASNKRSVLPVVSDSDHSLSSYPSCEEESSVWKCARTDVRVAGVPLKYSGDFCSDEAPEQAHLSTGVSTLPQQPELSYSDEILRQYVRADASLSTDLVSMHYDLGKVSEELLPSFSEIFAFDRAYAKEEVCLSR